MVLEPGYVYVPQDVNRKGVVRYSITPKDEACFPTEAIEAGLIITEKEHITNRKEVDVLVGKYLQTNRGATVEVRPADANDIRTKESIEWIYEITTFEFSTRNKNHIRSD